MAPSLQLNENLRFIDLSQCKLGVYGATLIAKALQHSKTIKGLNLFHNNIDVDGARAIRELLKVNKTLVFLDLSHNRIRQKGLEAIQEGILAQEKTKLKQLAIRMNFINDDGFDRFFREVILSGQSNIEHLYINENNLTQYKAVKLHERVKETN